jgi:hypothetical protein
MSSPVVKHAVEPGPGDEPDHPIPYLSVIDVAAYRKHGGATLTVVVASPLQDDEHSHSRLLDKIEGYLKFIASDQFLELAHATASPENTAITVALHPDTAPGVYSLLARCHQWVTSGRAKLVVRQLSAHELGGT